jgi:hypothetical protein
MNGAAEVGSDISDSNGNYGISNIDNGNYTIESFTTKVWGGISVFDGLYIQAAAAGYDMSPLGWTDINYLAADVDGGGTIQVFDALYAKAMAAGYSIPSYEIYKFIIPNVSVVNGVGTSDIQGLCNGDVDGSYTPPSK